MATPASASGFPHSPGAPTQIQGLSGNIPEVHEPGGNWQPGVPHNPVAEWRVDPPVTTEEVDFDDVRDLGPDRSSTRGSAHGSARQGVPGEPGHGMWLHGTRVEGTDLRVGYDPMGFVER